MKRNSTKIDFARSYLLACFGDKPWNHKLLTEGKEKRSLTNQLNFWQNTLLSGSGHHWIQSYEVSMYNWSFKHRYFRLRYHSLKYPCFKYPALWEVWRPLCLIRRLPTEPIIAMIIMIVGVLLSTLQAQGNRVMYRWTFEPLNLNLRISVGAVDHTANFSCVRISRILLIFTESGTEFICAHAKRVYLFFFRTRKCANGYREQKQWCSYFRETPRNTRFSNATAIRCTCR